MHEFGHGWSLYLFTGKEWGIMDGSNSSFSRRKHIRLKLGASSSQIFSEPLSSRCTQLSRAATAIRVNMG